LSGNFLDVIHVHFLTPFVFTRFAGYYP
jgi:hypothetical protein